jgi:hypothetical protein
VALVVVAQGDFPQVEVRLHQGKEMLAAVHLVLGLITMVAVAVVRVRLERLVLTA